MLVGFATFVASLGLIRKGLRLRLVLARCRVKAASEITGSHSYVMALRVALRILSVGKLFALVYTKNTPTHVHVSLV